MQGGEENTTLALAKRLQAVRQQAGLTQQELCQKAGLAYSTLAKIERGAIKSPSVFTIADIATTLGVSLDELVGNSEVSSTKKTTASGISFVYFDVNGCLIHFFQKAFTKLAEDTNRPQELVETAFWHYNDGICRGDLAIDEFNSKFAKRLGVKNLDWVSYYLEAIEPIRGMSELLDWVAKDYRVGLLTNIMPTILDTLRHRRVIPDLNYDAVVDSSEVGAIKPDKEIYEIAQAKAGVNPSEILFVDDSRVNLTAAERLGWHVMWFDGHNAEESINRVRSALQPA